MRTARAHGIPLSVGRGLRSPVARWTEQDWALANALEMYEGLICSGCGQPLHESMDPASEREWVAPLPMRCHACTAIEHRKGDYSESEAPGALRFHAERFRRPQREETAHRH